MNRFDLNEIDIKNITPELVMKMYNTSYRILNMISSKWIPFSDDKYSLVSREDKNAFKEYDQDININRSTYWVNKLSKYKDPIKFIKHVLSILKEKEDEYYHKIEFLRTCTDLEGCKSILDETIDYTILFTFIGNKLCEILVCKYFNINNINELDDPNHYKLLIDLAGTICQFSNIRTDGEDNKYILMGYMQAVFLMMNGFPKIHLLEALELYKNIGLITENDIAFVRNESVNKHQNLEEDVQYIN